MTALISAFAGLIVGSFLTVLIPRLHEDKPGILTGRSECRSCQNTLMAQDLIPLLSFLAHRGKCRQCHTPISLWYPLIEVATAGSFVALSLTTDSVPLLIWNMLLTSIFLFIFFYDLRYKEIHDAVMLPAIFIATVGAVLQGHTVDALLGAGIGFGFFGLQYTLSKGQWVGSGDMRIGAFMGLVLGWQLTLLALVISYIFGSLVSLYLLATGKAHSKTALPLGPFLVVGSVVAFFYGNSILEWYLTHSTSLF